MIWLVLAFTVLILPIRWLLAAVLAAVVHEFGHYLALRLCDVPVQRIRISAEGTFMQVGQMNRIQTIICALAGPLAGFCLLFVARWFPRTAICACIHSAYNLLPIYPLDGGRIMQAAIWNEAVCRWIERVCLCLIVLAGLYGCFILHLGVLPLFISVLTLRRALIGKGLENRGVFRYNRERIYE